MDIFCFSLQAKRLSFCKVCICNFARLLAVRYRICSKRSVDSNERVSYCSFKITIKGHVANVVRRVTQSSVVDGCFEVQAGQSGDH